VERAPRPASHAWRDRLPQVARTRTRALRARRAAWVFRATVPPCRLAALPVSMPTAVNRNAMSAFMTISFRTSKPSSATRASLGRLRRVVPSARARHVRNARKATSATAPAARRSAVLAAFHPRDRVLANHAAPTTSIVHRASLNARRAKVARSRRVATRSVVRHARCAPLVLSAMAQGAVCLAPKVSSLVRQQRSALSTKIATP